MGEDPVVDEVRKHRDELAAAFNCDPKAIGEDIKRRQKASGRKLVSPPRKKAAG